MGIKWDKSPDGIADELENHIFDVLNTLTAMTYNNIVALSPVDTGRYRNAHHFSHGSPSHAMSGATSIRIPVGITDPSIFKITYRMPYASKMAGLVKPQAVCMAMRLIVRWQVWDKPLNQAVF